LAATVESAKVWSLQTVLPSIIVSANDAFDSKHGVWHMVDAVSQPSGSSFQTSSVEGTQTGEMAELLRLINAGDFEAALTYVQKNKIAGLEEQYKERLVAMQARNDLIKSKNYDLADLQRRLANFTEDDDKAWAQSAITALKGEIDALNSDQQLDMIAFNSLATKREQAFEMLSNSYAKISKTKDTINRNI
jgi:hypothetical protein